MNPGAGEEAFAGGAERGVAPPAAVINGGEGADGFGARRVGRPLRRCGVERNVVAGVTEVEPVAVGEVAGLVEAVAPDPGAVQPGRRGRGLDAREVFAVEAVEDAADFGAEIVGEGVVAEQFLVREHRAMPVAGGEGGGGEVGLVGVGAGDKLLVLEVAEHGVGLGVAFREIVAGAEKIAALVVARVESEVALGEPQDGGGILLFNGEGGEGEEGLAVGRMGGENFGGEGLGEMGLAEAGVKVNEVAQFFDGEGGGAIENLVIGKRGPGGVFGRLRRGQARAPQGEGEESGDEARGGAHGFPPAVASWVARRWRASA